MNKALVVIDVQNYYIRKHVKDLPAKIAGYIKASDFDYVLFTKFVNNENSSLSKLLNWRKMQAPPDTDIHEALRTYATPDRVFEKNTYSAFKSKQFVDFLVAHDITELILCGLDTDACILATLYDAFDRGYKVNIIDELSNSHSGEVFHRFALQIINKNLRNGQ